jgi:hypothetical protein
MQLLLGFDNVRLPVPDSGEHVWPDPGYFGQILPKLGQIRPASNHGRILARFGPNLVCRLPATVAECRQILAPPGFRQPTIAEFRQSDIKHACKDQEFNFGKRFTVLKTVNRFPKIKKTFTVKPKMISSTIIFTSTKRCKMSKSFFRNHFTSKQTKH